MYITKSFSDPFGPCQIVCPCLAMKVNSPAECRVVLFSCPVKHRDSHKSAQNCGKTFPTMSYKQTMMLSWMVLNPTIPTVQTTCWACQLFAFSYQPGSRPRRSERKSLMSQTWDESLKNVLQISRTPPISVVRIYSKSGTCKLQHRHLCKEFQCHQQVTIELIWVELHIKTSIQTFQKKNWTFSQTFVILSQTSFETRLFCPTFWALKFGPGPWWTLWPAVASPHRWLEASAPLPLEFCSSLLRPGRGDRFRDWLNVDFGDKKQHCFFLKNGSKWQMVKCSTVRFMNCILLYFWNV